MTKKFIELLEWYENKKFSSKYLKTYKEFNEIVVLTNFLNKDVGLKQRIWHIKNEVFCTQKCMMCENEVNFNRHKNEYSKTCSYECEKNRRNTNEYKDYLKNNKLTINNHKEQIIITNNKKFGKDNYSSSDLCKKTTITNFQKMIGDDYLINDFSHKSLTNKHFIILCKECEKEFVLSESTIRNRLKNNIKLCTNCNPIIKGYSIKEKEILNYIKSFYKKTIIENDREVLKNCGKNNTNLELDIYIPDLKMAIEFNGDNIHCNPKIYKSDDISTFHKKPVVEIWKKDNIKKDLCSERDIDLLIIWERDWLERNNVIKRYLKIKLALK